MKSDFESQRILHAAQREALASAQKSERTNLFKGSWRGRGDALNAQRSIVASEQMKARLNTNDRMKNERAGLRAQYRPFPDFESWLRARGTLESQEQARSWRYRKHSDQMAQLDRNGLFGEDIKPKPVDLRAELSQVDGPVVHYTDTQRFRDDLPWS